MWGKKVWEWVEWVREGHLSGYQRISENPFKTYLRPYLGIFLEKLKMRQDKMDRKNLVLKISPNYKLKYFFKISTSQLVQFLK